MAVGTGWVNLNPENMTGLILCSLMCHAIVPPRIVGMGLPQGIIKIQAARQISRIFS
jgi:hypothetical protein